MEEIALRALPREEIEDDGLSESTDSLHQGQHHNLSHRDPISNHSKSEHSPVPEPYHGRQNPTTAPLSKCTSVSSGVADRLGTSDHCHPPESNDVKAVPLLASPWASAPLSSVTYQSPHLQIETQTAARRDHTSFQEVQPQRDSNWILDQVKSPNLSKPQNDHVDEEDGAIDAEPSEDEEYQPTGAINYSGQRTLQRISNKPKSRSRRLANSVTFTPTSKPKAPAETGATTCPYCRQHFSSEATLHKHTLVTHTRPFHCLFARYGCPHTFGSKNEWARHIRRQHLRLEIWKCDIGKCEKAKSEFDRKDLFTQHMRRMHPEVFPSTEPKLDRMELARTEILIQQRCHIALRSLPSNLICTICSDPSSSHTKPSPLPLGTFETAMEHYAGHLEKGEGLGEEQQVLRHWLEKEGLLNWMGEGNGWEIVGCRNKKRHGQKSRRTSKRRVILKEGKQDDEYEWVFV